jgi:adenosylcobalamin-dependent ribonucleoside-triphosphate reductase
MAKRTLKKNSKKTSAKVNKTTNTKKKTTKTKSNKSKFVKNVRKRDGSIVSFELQKITDAIYKALANTNEGDMEDAIMVANHVHSELAKISKTFKGFVPTVEGIQDIVEQQLIVNQYPNTSKHYILYREERAKIREQKAIVIPEKVKKLASDSKKYFRNPLAEFVYYRTYSKWIDSENRRETWIETVGRYIEFMKKNLGNKLKDSEYEEIREAILKQEIMPSMRLMQFAGEAAEKTNVCAYNCSFIAPSKIKDFSEIMYVCMCGTGVGFAVESENVQKFPQIQKQTGKKRATFVVPDSTEGWCDSLNAGLEAWFAGEDIEFDYSQVRPEGERLKTKGGKASGPAPLKELHEFCKNKVISKQGRRLSNIDVHDIACMIGRVVVVGGVRRSAMISLSELNDYDMREAKDGQFWINQPQRSMANNSAVYEVKPTTTDFLDEWVSLMKSGTGERGIFNRGSLKTQLPERRIEAVGPDTQWGTNPCGEIILQSKQFCNLSEVVCRSNDTEASLLKKIRLATILGTYQASLTKFPYLSKRWKDNCENEALLGVSLTGQWDCEAVRDDKVLQKLRKETIKVNKQFAKRLKMNQHVLQLQNLQEQFLKL